ncbi:MAG: DUF3090 domain-containing protein [Thermomicrobiales bacterium]|nr:DUF3090 domain-containing protein [Thermomicrobiales bacterium]
MSESEGREISPIDVRWANVEALGEPGQRRFRLLLSSGDETTVLWMEKLQVDALGRALEQLLDQLPGTPEETVAPDTEPRFDLGSDRQFRVGKLEIGYDEARDRIVIIAYDLEELEEFGPAALCRLTRIQAAEIADEAERVVAAGRPRCVMCGMPMGPGPHACANQNGHLRSEYEQL